jgi:hypothetical protein
MSSSVTGRSIEPFPVCLSAPLLHSANSLFVPMRLREQQFFATYNFHTKVLAVRESRGHTERKAVRNFRYGGIKALKSAPDQ